MNTAESEQQAISVGSVWSINKIVGGVAGVLAVAFWVAVLMSGHWGGPVVEGMANAIGEIHLEEGMRLDTAGDVVGAEQAYEQALKARFQYPDNRVYTLRLLGGLLQRVGRPEEAIRRLQQMVALPDCPVKIFAPYVASLVDVHRYDEAVQVVERWFKAAQMANNSDEMEQAKAWREKVLAAKG